MKWIKCSTRLPTANDADENGKVLIHRKTNAGQAGMSKSIYDWGMVKYCDEKTSWMPLPSAPNEENTEG